MISVFVHMGMQSCHTLPKDHSQLLFWLTVSDRKCLLWEQTSASLKFEVQAALVVCDYTALTALDVNLTLQWEPCASTANC